MDCLPSANALKQYNCNMGGESFDDDSFYVIELGSLPYCHKSRHYSQSPVANVVSVYKGLGLAHYNLNSIIG